NALTAAVAAKGVTILRNAACEPHVQDLARFLVALGARIQGIGTNMLTIEGGHPLHGATHRIGPDHIEVGSFIGLAAVTGSELRISDAGVEHLQSIRMGFARLRGAQVESPDIRAGMAILLAALCATGESMIDNVGQIERGYERIDERLRALGAKIERIEERRQT